MSRIGLFCISAAGHLFPMCALGRELQERGHEILFFNVPDAEEDISKAQIPFCRFGDKYHPAGTIARRDEGVGKLEGLAGSAYMDQYLVGYVRAVFEEAAPLLEAANVDLLVVDQTDVSSSSLAAALKIPFVTVTLPLMFNYEDSVPHWSSGEPYSNDPALFERRRSVRNFVSDMFGCYRSTLNEYRVKAGLPPYTHWDETWSTLAQISPQPAAFEYPRQALPATFHFTGPFLKAGCRPASTFPFEKLSGKPLIYASFGTMLNRYLEMFRVIAKACVGLDFQLLISLGGGSSPEELGSLPGDPLVMKFVPQLEILPRASLMITHAGMNSALECLAAGVPMVAVPVSLDQPGVAARIAWTGMGVVIPLQECTVPALRSRIDEVLGNPSYRERAKWFKETIAAADGLGKAASIIEKVAATKAPILRQRTAPASSLGQGTAPYPGASRTDSGVGA